MKKLYSVFLCTLLTACSNSGYVVQIPPHQAVTVSTLSQTITSQDLTFKNNEKGYRLKGTLTLPKEGSSFSAVIILGGSGPTDRDGSAGPNKPYREIAESLSNSGIAVLRFDKSVRSNPEAFNKRFTIYDEYVSDAVEAVRFLEQHQQIASDKIFILGHSQGGTVTPEVLKKAPSVKGGIIMAGLARDFGQSLYEQIKYISEADGVISPMEKQQIMYFEKVKNDVALLKSDDGKSSILNMPTSYWLSMKNLKPVDTAAGLKQPLLVLQGERDYQVTVEDFNLWKKGLFDKKHSFKLYPSLNHLFMAGTGKILPDEYNRKANVSQELIKDVTEWLKKQ